MRASRSPLHPNANRRGPDSTLDRAVGLLHRPIGLSRALRTPIGLHHFGVAVAVTAIAAGGVTAGHTVRSANHAPAPHESESNLVENAGCHETATVGAPSAGNTRVVVPPTALVHVDGLGRVVAATTNTGCAPRLTDDVYVVEPSGDVRLADPGLAARAWIGDFRTRGTLVSQSQPG